MISLKYFKLLKISCNDGANVYTKLTQNRYKLDQSDQLNKFLEFNFDDHKSATLIAKFVEFYPNFWVIFNKK